MANVKIFFAKEATVKIDAAGDVSISNSTVLDTAFASAKTITGQFKNVSATLATADVDKIDLMGTTSSYQNGEIEEKPAGIVEISGTIVIPGDEMMEGEIFGSGTAAGGTHTTYEPGLATRTKLALLINLDDGTDEVNYAGTNFFNTEYNVNLTGADGHFEATVTFKCMARDFFGPQFKN